MEYKVKVNEAVEFDITQEEVITLDAITISPNQLHVLHNYKSYVVDILETHFHSKTYTVAIDNKTYRVVINNELDTLIKDMGFAMGSKKQVNSIKAPMPGLVLDIPVTIGQQVKEGETLLILEAMKMENSIIAPITGIIKSIKANKGDSVEKNQLLIEFDV